MYQCVHINSQYEYLYMYIHIANIIPIEIYSQFLLLKPFIYIYI